jgi:hypothetical protein
MERSVENGRVSTTTRLHAGGLHALINCLSYTNIVASSGRPDVDYRASTCTIVRTKRYRTTIATITAAVCVRLSRDPPSPAVAV